MKFQARINRFYFCLSFQLAVVSFCSAQVGNFYIRNFTASDYGSENHTVGPQNFNVITDSRGVIYVANSYGVLEYDGSNWRKVNSEDELNFKQIFFTINSKGRIFLGTSNDLGYLAADSLGLLKFKSLHSELHKSQYNITSVSCIHDTIYFVSDSSIFIYAGNHFSTISAPGLIQMASKIGASVFCCVQDKGLFQLKSDHFEFITGSEEFSSIKPIAFIPDTTHNFLSSVTTIVGRNGIYRWDGHSLVTVVANSPRFKRINCAVLLNDQEIALGTDANGLIVCDFFGRVLKVFNKASGINDNAVNYLYRDQENGLWLALASGISRIEFPSPLTYFNDRNGVEGIVLTEKKYQNQLYIGTYTGLYKLSDEENNNFTKVDTLGYISDLLTIKGDLVISGVDGVLIQHQSIRNKIASEIAYQLFYTPAFPDYFFLAFSDGIGVASRKNNHWSILGKIHNLNNSITRIVSDNHGFLYAGDTSFYKIDFREGISLTPVINSIPVSKKHQSNDVSYLFSYQNEIMLGTTNNGFFIYDSAQNHFISDSTLNNLTGQYHEVKVPYVDEDGELWFSTDGKVKVIYNNNGSYIFDTLPFMRIPKTEVWGFFKDEEHVMWIGTNDGVYRYYAAIPKNYSLPYNVLLRNVRTNGVTIFHGTFISENELTAQQQPSAQTPEIKFHSNDLLFEYAAISYDSKEKNLYRYFLEGRDGKWSSWQSDTKKEFTNLHQGEYVFHIKAKNIYGVESREATYKFTILPPWFRTWWAYLIYLLVAFLLVRGIIQLNQYRLINEKKVLVRKVIKRTEQISKQKEIIEAEKEKVEKKSIELEETLATLKRTQNQLLLSEKLASVGQLTAGVAHEINNPINFVSGNINPLKKNFEALKRLLHKMDDLKNDSNLQSHLQEFEELKKEIDFDYTIDESEKLLSGIEEGSRRTAAIVKGLRQFSRIDEDVKKKANINEGIESTLVLLQNKMKFQNIEAVLRLGEIPDINCYPGQLNQVFMNLFTNAVDAIGDLSSSSESSPERKIFITTSADKQSVKISVRDTGQGMSEEVRKKIFDPFFTTKEVGKGTGLGLSISYGIIEKHNGTIEVKSEIGKGTEFIISLPA